MKRSFFLTFLGACSLVALYGQPGISKVQYGFVAAKNINLETDIYFKDTTGRYPVIMMRTPYPRKQYASIAEYFCKQNYIVVIQSVRGTGGSGGRMMPFINETEDGLAMLDLLTEKSWCNGNIGMYGSSYSSFCGLTLGASKHPSLKAIVNINGWVEPSIIARPSGVNHIMMNIPWMLFNYTNGRLIPGKYNADSLLKTVPVNTMLKGYGVDISLEQMQEGIDGLNKDMLYKDFDVPVMHVTGMYDFTREGTFNLYDSLRKYNKTQRIIIGPWVHDQLFNPAGQKVGDWELAKAGYDSIGAKTLISAANWFKLYVKKEPLAAPPTFLRAMPVFSQSFNLNAMGHPDEKIGPVGFYLGGTAGNGGKLLKKNVPEQSSFSFTSNPNDPVPTNGGANFHFFVNNIGLKKQNELEKRNDVITYTSEKINGQFWGLGKARVKLFVSYGSADCDFTAKLVAVDKEDNAWIITEGITRMSQTEKKATGLNDTEGNMIYEIEIDLGHIVFQLMPRWNIRLEIAGSNFPKYDRNPGNGSNPLLATKFYPVKQTIHQGKQFPSVLLVDELD